MAQKLHSVYGFSYDNLKVLLGGWHAWQTANYPMVVATPGPTVPANATVPGGAAPQTPIPLQPNIVITPKP